MPMIGRTAKELSPPPRCGVLGIAPSHADRDLRERSFGRFEGLTRDECTARFPEAWALYSTDPRTAPPDGELQEQLLARTMATVLRAVTTVAATAPMLIVT